MEKESDFFDYYKEFKAKQHDLAIMEDYFLNSDDFKMDCEPMPLPKKEVNKS